MKKLLVSIAIFLLASPVYAADVMEPVFGQIDDLITRVESGISLNSYAESLAQMKIDYKKAQGDKDNVDNPLLSDRMKKVLMYLDDYSLAWRWMEIDGRKYVQFPPSYVSKSACAVNTRRGTMHDIPCVKNEILATAKEAIGSAKSAHFNGW